MPARCKSCGARIIWALTEANRRMPVDAQTYTDGNLALTDELDGSTPRVVMDTEQQTPGPWFKSHFATCPNADRHRRADRQGTLI